METPYWTKVIAEAKARRQRGEPPFTSEEEDAARGWVSCACGMQDSRLHDASGAPYDVQLESLGYDFTDAVVDEADPGLAEHVLAKIEARAAELLAGMKP